MSSRSIGVVLFGCFSRNKKGDKSHIVSPVKNKNKNTDNAEFRLRGQEVLKALLEDDNSETSNEYCYGTNHINSNNNQRMKNKFNWNTIVRNTKDLPKEEKEKFNRHQKINRLKLLKRAMERRRLDNTGSWNANIVTYYDNDKPIRKKISHENKGGSSTSNVNLSLEANTTKFVSDEISRSSCSTRSIGTLQVIDEELEYLQIAI
jgi:hypothetical protein